ncbi:endo alpha-1,4 polygalactosaminidase [Streptomyces iconiensis]|uniref:Endo alpha-1,4 polygalactosaminidase n=1 Tax=Streptomyces iconiensis TaxID=1384038 RepID=A0ABT6ZYX0_9ACTN|nr:endo alpha-1,4 polygalactosaminidase [Streptomyces iconiensis]MDJ1134268.1 endo alpha-1,4 polygalactosaminidase [Streptomyces iconiensis]
MAALLLALGACAPSTPSTKEKSDDGVRLPAAGAVFDYQLGGAYPPASDVEVVSRDRRAEPARDAYNVCYVNAFQTQPGDAVDWWREHHPRLLLRDDDGDLVIDEDWDEPLLDISTSARRTALLRVVGRWIDGCAKDGFDAVEFDNLDSYERSDDQLTTKDATAFARQLAKRAHARGLAVGQKNTADLLPQRSRIGFDFAVVEECARYGECKPFATAYDDRVFDIEYRARDFTRACRTWSDRLSVTLRDLDVLPAGKKGHVSRHC